MTDRSIARRIVELRRRSLRPTHHPPAPLAWASSRSIRLFPRARTKCSETDAKAHSPREWSLCRIDQIEGRAFVRHG